MQEQFDAVARQLAREDVSRRRFLGLLGGLGGAAGLAAVGAGPARAYEDDPLTTSGYRRSELKAVARNPPPQAFCARLNVGDDAPCFLGLCSTQCAGGLDGLGACFPPVGRSGPPRCGAVFFCKTTPNCSSDADCGPREFCAQTCCPSDVGGNNKCAPLCST